MDATHRGEVARRDLPEFGGEVADVGFPEFIGCGSNVCWLDRPPQGKSNGKGVCECFGDLLPIKRMLVLKYIRRDKAEIDALRARLELFAKIAEPETLVRDMQLARLLLMALWRTFDAGGESYGRTPRNVALESAMDLLDRHFQREAEMRKALDIDTWKFIHDARVEVFNRKADDLEKEMQREAMSCPACCGSGVRDDVRWGGIADTTPCDECGGTGVVEYPASDEKCECGGQEHP